MQRSYPGINPSIAEWKGQEITDLQEELRIRVNANISEKWFYTHMKSSNPTVPRIDMLNILSKYAGYSNWDDFVFKNGQRIVVPAALQAAPATLSGANRFFILVPGIAMAVVALLFGLYMLFNTREYCFAFVDADTGEPVKGSRTEIILLEEGESPVHHFAATDGSFHLKTGSSRLRMVVKSPYYLSDTIIRIVKKFNRNETIILKPDDYALMIHYFSTTKLGDWEKRKQRLEEMIDDNAMIYQVMNAREATGMALYNKQEFIDRMTIPSGSLKNIEILSSRMKNGKIVVLRFRVNDKRK